VSAEPETPERSRPEEEVGNPDWSPWVLLLIIPIVLPLVPAIYNRVDPELWGMPAFYWIQLVFVPMSAVCTGMVYLMTRKKVGHHG
jgi:hypothetical protein